MGRVSRILKAVTDKEPGTKASGTESSLPHADPDLPRLIACWSAMPPHFKQTILTLVELVEAKRRSVTVVGHSEPPPPQPAPEAEPPAPPEAAPPPE
jgi:hypothetical protein